MARTKEDSARPPRRPRLKVALLLLMLLAGAGVILLRYAASDSLPQPGATAILDAVMPAYDVQEVHATHVNAPPARAYAATLAVTMGEIALARQFMWVRTLPARLGGEATGARGDLWDRPLLSVPGTAMLGRAPDREVVVGVIGQFWKLRPGQRVAVRSREQFMAFGEPGFAVSTLSVHVEADERGSRVTTITRVRATDAASRRAFLRYWRAIGTGSAILRRTWLRAVKARAEG